MQVRIQEEDEARRSRYAESQGRTSLKDQGNRWLYLTGLGAVVIVASLLQKIRGFMAKSTICETEKAARQRLAAELATDKKVLNSVAQSRAAYELGKRITLDQAFPKVGVAKRQA